MAPMLRLASKDRSSFFFKKSGQQNVGSSQDDPLSGTELPQISHVDTASLINLFDRFNSFEQNAQQNDRVLSHLMQGPTSARDFAWPVGSGTMSTSALRFHTSPANRSAPALSRNDAAMANMARNDSTGSSSLSRRSDSTPPMTRQSSSSSVTPAVSPLLSDKARTTTKEITALSDVRNAGTVLGSPARPRPQRRSNTWGSSTCSSSQQLNLDKPLPVGPPVQSQRHSNSSGRRKHKRVDSLDSAAFFRGAASPVESPTRFESLRKHSRSTTVNLPLSNGQLVAELPTQSPPTSRGARLGRAIVQGNTTPRLRSKSETLLEGVNVIKDRSYRSSAPVDVARAAEKRRSLQKRAVQPIAARTAEQVIYRIMCQLEDPRDLQSAAMVSKGFLNTYQRNESKIVSHLIFKGSRPAWELRRSTVALQGSKTFRLRDYQGDLRTIKALKALVLVQCRNSCKAKTIAGLLGNDKLCEREVDNALWRIWTFCALFGDNAFQNPVPRAQLDWLNGSNGAKSHVLGAGFAIGNGGGLTVDELEDMSEMWSCLQNLVSQFHGREEEAKRAGVFDNWHLNETTSAHQHVAEWTAYLLTLGPQVILALSFGSFDNAKMLGLTNWTLPPRGQSRSGFLTAAISHVYQQRILAEATAKAAQITIPPGPKHRPTKSCDAVPFASSTTLRQLSLRIDTQSIRKRRPTSTIAPRTAPPVEIRPDCDPAVLLPYTSHPAHVRSVSNPTLFPASPTADPTFFHTLNLTANTASVKLGATLFPMDYTPSTPRVPFLPPQPTRAPPPLPGVVDPIDKAMDLLVKELGFKETNAKRALAMCDSGSGVDVDRAIELLAIESRREAMATAAPIELPTPADIVSPLNLPSATGTLMTIGTRKQRGRREYCDGGCKRATTSSGKSFASATTTVYSPVHSRNRSAGNRMQLLPHRYSAEDDNSNYDDNDNYNDNVSPITDIYGGHSDSDGPNDDDDGSEVWRRREGNDTISPLMSTPVSFRGGVSRMGSTQRAAGKAWKVLGVSPPHAPDQQDEGVKGAMSIKGGLARMRSKSSSASAVVGMEEYSRRVERRRSMRMVQVAEKRGVGLGVVSAGVAEQLKGLGLGSACVGLGVTMRGGLGGLRVVEREVVVEGKERSRWRVRSGGM